MNTRILTAALTASLALPLCARAQGESMFPAYTNTPYGVPIRLGEQPMAPVVASPQPVAPVVPTVPAAMPPQQQMVPAAMPQQVQVRHSPFTLDVRGYYGFRAVPNSACATDMAGMEAEFACYLNPFQAVTFSGSFGYGRHDAHDFAGPAFAPEDFSRSDFSLMVGYRFTQPLTPYTSLSFGIKGGLDVQELSCDDAWGAPRGDRRETGCGFGYAASAMLETKLSRRTMLQVGYQFRGSTTKPDCPERAFGAPPVSVHSLRWHEVHVGVRVLF